PGDTRNGAKRLEAMWKKQPHPEVADLYVHARPGDSTHDRLDRAKKLQSLRLNHAESAMVVARAALDANEFAIARREAESAIRLEPREGAYLLLADIEEAETGDQGKIRQYLGKAVRAPRAPAWVADSYVADKWAPISPVTGRLDAFEWRAPTERLGQLVEFGDEDQVRPPVAALPAAIVEEAEQPATPEPPVEAEKAPAPAPEEKPAPAESERPPEAPATVVSPAAAEATEEPAAPPPLPDDPGVEDEGEEDEQDEARRFRLF